MSRVKSHELRAKKKDELATLLDEQKTELASVLVSKVTAGPTSKLSKIRVIKKNIARILTVINQTQRENLRKLYKNKKHVPLDLRVKKTRAIRRALTKRQLSLRTHKQLAKACRTPTRVYALKA
ncbi:50S ribosomal protein L29 [Aphelenchoides besseyi]|nr:50S ribosomal protein L29 [Aphelenchoides besseyi]KAI6209512.1 50S ribosomal protein L29 [Aphelenchoides besseyi]